MNEDTRLLLRYVIRNTLTAICMFAVICMGAFLFGSWFARADAAPNHYTLCANEDSRVCVYDADHNTLDYAPWSFYINANGRVWRLPHHIAHHLLYGSDREYMRCLTEDSKPCVWIADMSGNRQGRSFFVNQHDVIWYLPHHVAYNLVYGS